MGHTGEALHFDLKNAAKNYTLKVNTYISNIQQKIKSSKHTHASN